MNFNTVMAVEDLYNQPELIEQIAKTRLLKDNRFKSSQMKQYINDILFDEEGGLLNYLNLVLEDSVQPNDNISLGEFIKDYVDSYIYALEITYFEDEYDEYIEDVLNASQSEVYELVCEEDFAITIDWNKI